MAQIFISYALEDGKSVQQLYQRLKDAGYSPWMDKVDLIGGQLWERAIEKAIKDSDFFIICLSSNSVKKRGFVQREIRVALDLWQEKTPDDVFLIPVKLEPLAREEVPEEIAKFQWIDWHEDYGWLQLERSLEHGIEQRGLKSTRSATQGQAKVPSIEPKKTDHRQPSTDHQLPTFEFTTVTLDRSGNVVKRRQGKAQYFTEETGGIDLEMVHVPGGTFEMGTNASEAIEVRTEIERYWKGRGNWVDTELPQHEVTVPSFFMGKFQITQAQWRTVARWSKVKIDLSLDPSNFKGDTLPVEQVSWSDAREFCARLSKKTGKLYRLPTEAEWEYACRAGTMTPFAFGETITPEFVNYDGNYLYAGARKGEYRKQPTPVGNLGLANGFGLFDMHGNVWEWCEDVWHQNYNNAPEDGSVWLGAGDLSCRVRRGGAWDFYGLSCRSANRNRYVSSAISSNIGFRVVVAASSE